MKTEGGEDGQIGELKSAGWDITVTGIHFPYCPRAE